MVILLRALWSNPSLMATSKLLFSPLTVCELWQSGDIDRRTEIGFLSVLRFVEEAPPDIETARTAGLWVADYQKSDEARSSDREVSHTALVAATAIRLGVPICTRAADVFAQFDVGKSPRTELSLKATPKATRKIWCFRLDHGSHADFSRVRTAAVVLMPKSKTQTQIRLVRC